MEFKVSFMKNKVVNINGFTLVELLVVITVIGMLVALTLPAVQSARESARRIQCTNNLKQLGLAVQSHENIHQKYPSGGWGFQWYVDGDRGFDKRQPGGWPYAVLPHIEQTPLYESVKRKSGVAKQEALTTLLTTPVSLFNCTSRRAKGVYPWQENDIGAFPYNLDDYPADAVKTDYAINGGDNDPQLGNIPFTLEQGDNAHFLWNDFSKANGICFLRSEVTTVHVVDGLSNTYCIGEKWVRTSAEQDRGDDTSMYCGFDKDNTRWTNLLPMNDNTKEGWDQFGSAHLGVCLFVFCDGSTKPISYNIASEIHRYLGVRNDQKVIQIP